MSARLRVGLRTQILARLVLMTAGIFVLVSLVVLALTQRTLLREATHVAETLGAVAATVSGAAIDPEWTLHDDVNAQNLQRVVELFAESFGAERVEIADRAGMVVARAPAGPGAGGPSDQLVDHAAARDAEDAIQRTEVRERRIVVTRPVRDDAGELRATVRVSIGLQRVDEQIRRTQGLILLYLGLDLLLVFVVGYLLLTRLVVLPLARVSAATDRTARGEFPSRIDDAGTNEIADLARNFNTMVERVRGSRTALEAKVQELEVANELLQRTRDELVRSEKLATVGQLAAGIAHEVGNPLSAVIGLVDLFEMLASDGTMSAEEARDLAGRIRRELARMDATIRELLRFARSDDEPVGRVDVQAAVEQAMMLVQHHARGRDMRVVMTTPDAPLWARGTENGLVQVVLNLLLNAADAMGGQGEIDVSLAADGAGVRVRVDDGGPGIPEALRGRVLEPFFTTKGPGSGTGLGLSISERVVRGFGGRIEVGESARGGARLDVWLPEAQDSPGMPSGK